MVFPKVPSPHVQYVHLPAPEKKSRGWQAESKNGSGSAAEGEHCQARSLLSLSLRQRIDLSSTRKLSWEAPCSLARRLLSDPPVLPPRAHGGDGGGEW